MNCPDPVAALLAELPQREHVPRRYLGPQGPDFQLGRYAYRRPRAIWVEPDPPYTAEWYDWRDRMDRASRARRERLGVSPPPRDDTWWGPTHDRREQET